MNATSTPTAVVTGASAGIGLETARGLADKGYRVLLVGRDPSRTRGAQVDIRTSSGNPLVECFVCDFSRLSDVRDLAGSLRAAAPRMDVLINNAGVWHQQRRVTPDGLEATFAVNHLAPFLLTRLLLPCLTGHGEARIVNVSSRLHKRVPALDLDDIHVGRSYRGLRVYARSKLANILFTLELAERLQGTCVVANSVHPGDVATRIVRDSRFLSVASDLVGGIALKTPKSGAATSLHVATSPTLSGVTGRYFARCREAKVSRLAQDRAMAAELWSLSDELVFRVIGKSGAPDSRPISAVHGA